MSDIKKIKMPFGKYAGELVYNISDINYLKWVYQNTKISGDLLKAIKFRVNIK